MELEKLQQNYHMSKNIIQRLEREKNILELRVKSARGSQIIIDDNRVEDLEKENRELIMDLESLKTKLEEFQRHAGGLGAKMLEEKLEAQERKIAVLELSSRSVNTVAEIERLQNINSSLQKDNLRLGSLNLELKLDLERTSSDSPRLRDQIRHLERFL